MGNEGASRIVDDDEFRARRDGIEPRGDGEVALSPAVDAENGFREGRFIQQLHPLRWGDEDDFGDFRALHERGERAGEDRDAFDGRGELVEAHAAAGSGGDEDGGAGHGWGIEPPEAGNAKVYDLPTPEAP